MRRIIFVFLFVVVIPLLLVNKSMAFTFSDSFEGSTIDPFWSIGDTWKNGDAILSNQQAHSGSQSLELYSTGYGSYGNTDLVLTHHFDQVMQGNYSIWFYDPGYSGMYANFVGSNTTNTYTNAITVQDWDSTYYHIYYHEGASTFAEWKTSFNRSIGWHEFSANVGMNGTDLYIDNALAYSDAHANGFNEIYLRFTTYFPTQVYFDDFHINANPVPEPSSIFLLGMGLFGLAAFRRRMERRG